MKSVDVQLEHGYLRIANRLAEALIDAPMSGMQFKIMHTLIRLTYGWRRRTVTLSHADLAKYVKTTASGAFRSALRDLINNGAVLQLEQGGGKVKSTLAIQKDFTKWGLYQVGADRLAIIYGERPESHDDLLFQADLFAADPAGDEAGGMPESGQGVRPDPGTGKGSKSLSGETYEGGKTVERQEKDRRASSSTPLDDVARLLDGLPSTQRAAWEAEIRAAEQGMHGPALSAEHIGLASREFVANGGLERPSLRHFRGYLQRTPTRAPPPSSPPDGEARASPARDNRPRKPTPSRAASPYADALSGDPDA